MFENYRRYRSWDCVFHSRAIVDETIAKLDHSPRSGIPFSVCTSLRVFDGTRQSSRE